MNRSFIFLVAFIIMLSLLIGCTGEKTEFEISPSDLDASLEEASSPLNITSPLFDENTSVLLPFDESGKLIWSPSVFIDITVWYEKETKGYEAFVSDISEAYVQIFADILSGMDKTLIYSVTDIIYPEMHTDDPQFGDCIYHIGVWDISEHLMGDVFIYKTADCGYLFFRIMSKPMFNDTYDFSIYTVSLENMWALEDFLEGFERRVEALGGDSEV